MNIYKMFFIACLLQAATILPCSYIKNIALMPGQMIMERNNQSVGFFPMGREERIKAIMKDFKTAQNGRCNLCTTATCTCGISAGMFYLSGGSLLPFVEPCASAACITGTFGYASTCIPCSDDKDNYEDLTGASKTK